MSDATKPAADPARGGSYLSPGPRPATISDLRTIQHRDRLLRTELSRVRESAAAWRNGLGGLLAALVGFSLIKGRSDVSQLASFWAGVVGVVLLFALIIGGLGALLLLRAAHGNPTVTATRDLPSGRAADHLETLASAKALRRGIAATLACALLLIGAVGITWYGPEKTKPALQIMTPTGTTCGSAMRLDNGTLVLKTKAGEVSANLSTAIALQAVEKCP